MAILSSDGNKILNNFDPVSGRSFNAVKVTNKPFGPAYTDADVDNSIIFKNKPEMGGGYSKRDYAVLDVSMFGAKGDNTNADMAFDKAIKYLKSIILMPGSYGRGKLRPALYVPAGAYRLSTSKLIEFTSFKIFGDGADDSVIFWEGGDEPVFDIGQFSTNIGDLFIGVQDCSFSKIRISHLNEGALGFRQGQGIRNNGGGSLKMDDVSIRGFKYGVNSVHGGDYNSYRRIVLEYCDTALYQGPGGQQFYGERIDIGGNNVEGMVFDRPAQVHIVQPVINNCNKASIVFECPGQTSTRQLASFNAAGASLFSKIVIDSPWLESNAGGQGVEHVTKDFILCTNSTVEAYRGIVINNPYIVAGQQGAIHPRSLLRNEGLAVQNIEINKPSFKGKMDYWTSNPGNGTRVLGALVENGYISPEISDTPSASVMFVEGANYQTERFGSISSAIKEITNVAKTEGLRTRVKGNGVVSYGFLSAGTWIDRFAIDVEQRIIYFGDPDSANPINIRWAGAPPTSGKFSIGSIVYNTSNTYTTTGWRCVGISPLTFEDLDSSGTSFYGSLSPEGVVFAKRGAIYQRDSATSVLWVKSTDKSVATGWKNIDGDIATVSTNQNITGIKTFKTINGVNDDESGLIHTFGSGGNRIEVRMAGSGAGARPVFRFYSNNVEVRSIDSNGRDIMSGVNSFFRFPRLTTAQRSALAVSASDVGSIIDNIDVNKLQRFNGSTWETINSTV